MITYSSCSGVRLRYSTYDNPVTNRREVYDNNTNKVVNFISKDVVDQMQTNNQLKNEIIKFKFMLITSRWNP